MAHLINRQVLPGRSLRALVLRASAPLLLIAMCAAAGVAQDDLVEEPTAEEKSLAVEAAKTPLARDETSYCDGDDDCFFEGKELNYCEEDEDCHSTGYSKLPCPAVCDCGDIAIHKDEQLRFRKIVESYQPASCPTARCEPYECKPPTCINGRCIAGRKVVSKSGSGES